MNKFGRTIFIILLVIFDVEYIFAQAKIPISSDEDIYNKAVLAYNNGEYEKALSLLWPIANSGDAKAQNMLGECYYNGYGLKQDLEMAVIWFRRAAEQGFNVAQYNLAESYMYGNGIGQDNNKALFWYNKAAQEDYIPAYLKIGIFYENTGDYVNAEKNYRHAAEKGNTTSLINLGRLYERGYGVPLDRRKAFKMYEKAASSGNEYGYYYLARCYLYGIGIEKNDRNAIKWFKIAANNWKEDNIDLNFTIGELLFKLEDAECFIWLKKSLDSGNPIAEIGIGACYAKGIGTEKDLTKAYNIFQKAANISLNNIDNYDMQIIMETYQCSGTFYLCWLNYTTNWNWMSKKETIRLFYTAQSYLYEHALDIFFLSDKEYSSMNNEFIKSAFYESYSTTEVVSSLKIIVPDILWPIDDIEKVSITTEEEIPIGEQLYALDENALIFSEETNTLCQKGDYKSVQDIEPDNSFNPFMRLNRIDNSDLTVKEGYGFIFRYKIKDIENEPFQYCRIYIDKVYTDNKGNVTKIDISYQLSRLK